MDDDSFKLQMVREMGTIREHMEETLRFRKTQTDMFEKFDDRLRIVENQMNIQGTKIKMQSSIIATATSALVAGVWQVWQWWQSVIGKHP